MKGILDDGSCEKLLKDSKKEKVVLKDDEANGVQWKSIAGIGFVLTVLKCCIKGLTDTIVKCVSGINPIVIVFFRSLIILSLIIPFSLVKDQPPFPSSLSLQDRLLLVFRSVIGLLQVMANFYALQEMPLGIVKMIISTKPVFTIVFARIFLSESCDLLDGFSILLMLGGVVTVIHPWDQQMLSTESGYSENFLLASLLLFLSTGMASNIGIILRKFKWVYFIKC